MVLRKIFYSWRYYMLDREDYAKCMQKDFAGNLNSVCLKCILFIQFALFYAIGVYAAGIESSSYLVMIAVSSASVILLVFTRRLHNKTKRGIPVKNRQVYASIIILYTIIMSTVGYLDVFLTPGSVVVVFIPFLMVSSLFVVASPVFTLLLTLSAPIVFIISSMLLKSPGHFQTDLLNISFAAQTAIIFSWLINVFRLSAMSNSIKLEEERNRYQFQSITDELTNLKNRRDFDNKFNRYLTDYRENDIFLCLAIADIDYFKEYNDHYGHLAGDECLRAVGTALLKPWDNKSVYVARIGGEEFALLWFEKEKRDVQNIALQLHTRVSGLKIPHAKSTVSEYISLSIGVCVVQSKKENNAQDAIYKIADNALYEAKKDGRNRVVIFNGDERGEA